MQSERMYAALKGLGKDARLVMLPYEAHGYRARKAYCMYCRNKSSGLINTC